MAKLGKLILFSLLPLIILIVLLEVILRLMGFMYSQTPLEMRILEEKRTGAMQSVLAWGDHMGTKLVKDSVELWVPAEGFAKGYSVTKPKDVVRVATLGDSCTWFCVGSDEPYPKIIEAVLNQKQAKRVEVLNAGVGSHSSYQGLQRLKHTVLPYKPDIITVSYGWNDHWISLIEDKNVKVQSELVTNIINFLERFRTFQLMNKIITQVRPKDADSSQKLRVVPADYMKNLNTIIDIAQKNHIKVILMTAPYYLPNFQPTSFFPYPKEKLIPLHQEYNQIVRMVAKERGVALVDLEAISQLLPEGMLLSKDGIHFGKTGCQFVAEVLAQKIMAENFIK